VDNGPPEFDSRQGIFFFFTSAIRLVVGFTHPPTGSYPVSKAAGE